MLSASMQRVLCAFQSQRMIAAQWHVQSADCKRLGMDLLHLLTVQQDAVGQASALSATATGQHEDNREHLTAAPT